MVLLCQKRELKWLGFFVVLVMIILLGCEPVDTQINQVSVDGVGSSAAVSEDVTSSMESSDITEKEKVEQADKIEEDTMMKTASKVKVEENMSVLSTEKELVPKKSVVSLQQPGWGKNVVVTKTTSHMMISSNGIPSHSVGTFPMMEDTNADGRPDNPNTMKSQQYNYKIPLAPQKASSTTSLPMGPIGIGLSGAVFFNPENAEKQDAVVVEVFDVCKGHPEMQGRYHYHQLSDCFEVGSEGHAFLIGYAFDGFGIYGTTEDTGKMASGLDSCNGHEDSVRGYHYHATKKYPYLLGCYRGVVEKSNFDQMGGGMMGGGGKGGQMPPQGAPPPPKGMIPPLPK